MKRLTALVSLSLLLGTAAQAADPIGPARVAQAVKRTITVGGDLKQWEGIPQYQVILSNGVPSVPVTHKGYFSLAYDDKNLYVLGVFDQDKDTVLTKLNADAAEWWNDDVFELFFHTTPFAKAPEDLHLAISPNGTRFKAYTFTTDYVSKGTIEDKRWVLELAIPLNKGPLPAVNSGDIWALKVGREHQKAAEYPLWPIGGDYNAPGNYGYVVFSDKAVDTAATAAMITEKLGLSPSGAPLTSRLSDIGSYSVYYGTSPAEVNKLTNFDLAIVQPSTLKAAQLKTLHDAGTRAVAYMSIGELDKGSPYTSRVKKEWILGENKNWGSQFINASEAGWQDIILEQADKLIKAGYDGFFLDTLDTAELYAQAKPGMVQIVEKLRAKYPDAVIVQNRGFSMLSATAPSIDAVMFEGYSSAYDFGTKKYNAISGDPSYVNDVAKRGLVVLALDYADPTQMDIITADYQRAQAAGFIPYVSTINLDKVYSPNP